MVRNIYDELVGDIGCIVDFFVCGVRMSTYDEING